MTVTFAEGSNVQAVKTSGGGHYAYTVPPGWKGIIRPTLGGYYFLPGFASVGPVQRDIIQDFILSPLHAQSPRRCLRSGELFGILPPISRKPCADIFSC